MLADIIKRRTLPATGLRPPRDGLIGLVWRIAADRSGAAVIESAFVLPVLLIMMTGIVDMGYMFAVRNNMASVSQDAARLVAVGNMTATEAKSYSKTKLMASGMPYTVNAAISGQNVIVDISVPNKDVVLVDFLGLFQTGNLKAQSSMRVL